MGIPESPGGNVWQGDDYEIFLATPVDDDDEKDGSGRGGGGGSN